MRTVLLSFGLALFVANTSFAQQTSMMSRLDINGDGKLTADEFPKPLAKLFGQLDKDGDGAVTAAEMPGGQGQAMQKKPAEPMNATPQRMQDSANDPSNSEIFRIFDRDKDGKLSQNEIPPKMREFQSVLDVNADGDISLAELNAARPKGNSDSSKMKTEEKALDDPKAKMLLKLLDKDKDGTLSREEVPERLRAGFQAIDRNYNSKIDPSELSLLLENYKDSMSPSSVPNRSGFGVRTSNQIFNDQDSDADGRLTKNEVSGQLSSSFKELDTNSDGKLDPREVENGLRAAKEGSRTR